MTITFTVIGKPQGKERPRVCRINGKTITYTPRKTIEYEQKIRAAYRSVSKVKFEKDIPLEIHITALFSVPKSKSKKVKNLMLSGEIKPTKKPDSDNCIKIILDALNKVCYCDDSQVCEVHFRKEYAEIPKIIIKIKELER